MKECVKNCIEELKWNFKLFLLRLRYPKAGKYTLIMLSWGYSLKDIDEMIDDLFIDEIEGKNIWELREEMAEIDSESWEPDTVC